MYGNEKQTTEELNLILEATRSENNFLVEEEPIGIPGYTWEDTLAAYEFNQITIEWIHKILSERNEGYPFTDDEKQTLLLREYVIFRRLCNNDSLLKSLLSSRIYDLEKLRRNHVPYSVYELEEML